MLFKKIDFKSHMLNKARALLPTTAAGLISCNTVFINNVHINIINMPKIIYLRFLVQLNIF